MINLQNIKLKVGDLVFTNTKSILSRMINIVQRGGLEHSKDTASHVAVITVIYADTVVLTEAVPAGIRLYDLSHYKRVIKGIKRIKEPLHMVEGLRLLHDQLGGKYDFSALLSIIFRASLRIFGKRAYQWSKTVKNFLNSRTRFFCSYKLQTLNL